MNSTTYAMMKSEPARTRAQDEEFQTERLTEVLVANRGRSASEIGEAILASVRSFWESVHESDDVTPVILKVME